MTRLFPDRLLARTGLAVFTALALIAAAVMPARPAERVDLLLVLASDVSRSVDYAKFQLQREGYAAAITDDRVLNAIRSGPLQRIAVAFVEWSGATAQKVVIDWTLIDGKASAQKFADQLIELPRAFADRTAIGARIDFALAQLDRALAKGVTINGLVILSDRPLAWNPEHTNPPGGLDKYYRDHVTGGPGAFVMVAENFGSFRQAIIGKLIAEIAMLDTGRVTVRD